MHYTMIYISFVLFFLFKYCISFLFFQIIYLQTLLTSIMLHKFSLFLFAHTDNQQVGSPSFSILFFSHKASLTIHTRTLKYTRNLSYLVNFIWISVRHFKRQFQKLERFWQCLFFLHPYLINLIMWVVACEFKCTTSIFS